jgi:hypothetical protein
MNRALGSGKDPGGRRDRTLERLGVPSRSRSAGALPQSTGVVSRHGGRADGRSPPGRGHYRARTSPTAGVGRARSMAVDGRGHGQGGGVSPSQSNMTLNPGGGVVHRPDTSYGPPSPGSLERSRPPTPGRPSSGVTGRTLPWAALSSRFPGGCLPPRSPTDTAAGGHDRSSAADVG